jgi:hypothetical protein
MALHALMWSVLAESKPEFRRSSWNSLTEDQIDKQLNAVVITGGVFLAILALSTLTGLTIQFIGSHYLFIVLHGLGILLSIISILNYWSVKLLWIPAVMTCILPAVIEITLGVLTIVIRD